MAQEKADDYCVWLGVSGGRRDKGLIVKIQTTYYKYLLIKEKGLQRRNAS